MASNFIRFHLSRLYLRYISINFGQTLQNNLLCQNFSLMWLPVGKYLVLHTHETLIKETNNPAVSLLYRRLCIMALSAIDGSGKEWLTVTSLELTSVELR